MDLNKRIDEIIWGDSEDVWNDTFSMLENEDVNPRIFVNEVMKWVMLKHDEYREKYFKVLEIQTRLQEPDSVLNLVSHYQKIMFRYRLVHDCCRVRACFFL
jgi:hypothetical protein